ncbi:MAG: hypothetical protein ACFHU9_03795 [Fluviicola sp.]
MKPSKFLLVFIAFTCALTLGCKKMSSAWVVGEVEVVDALTGEPLKVNVSIDYHTLPLLGQTIEKSESIGTTGADGKLKFKYKCGRRTTGHKLKVLRPAFYATAGLPYPTYTKKSVKAQGNNKIRIELDPWYPFQLRATNVSCFDANDSLWVTCQWGGEPWQEMTMTAVGCADTIFDPPYIYHEATQHSAFNQITFEVTTKKNGVVNTFSDTHGLLPAQLKEISISY